MKIVPEGVALGSTAENMLVTGFVGVMGEDGRLCVE